MNNTGQEVVLTQFAPAPKQAAVVLHHAEIAVNVRLVKFNEGRLKGGSLTSCRCGMISLTDHLSSLFSLPYE